MPRVWRTVRVFISSTFRDMHAERDYLVKFIFPQLRKLCESRSVTWGEVDLRWGIPDEQKAEGKVLPICLAEIQRCRPYFIGLLGERYGWVPDEIPQDLIERERWLEQHLQHSVTELEILHGVLNDPKMADHAFFYFRDPGYLNTLPPDQQPDFREVPTPEEIARYGEREATRRAEIRRQKLQALKTRIRQSRFPVREAYPDPQTLGQLVLQDLTAVIDRLFPKEAVPDPLAREAAEHEAFAQSRARVYIGREEYFRRLDEHAAGDGPPLVILGDSGIGKSALLANWALQSRGRTAETPQPSDTSVWSRLVRGLRSPSTASRQPVVLLHFIGASPYSADWAAMLRRILGELKRHFEIQQEIPDKPDDLRAAFANWLHMAAAKGRVILILDALNQLEDKEGAPDLVWLPPVIPANIRLILSTLPGRPLEDLTKRGWPTLAVAPFRLAERRQFIQNYLAQYTKTLAPRLATQLAAAPQTANPLFLQALLEELRVFGAHERLEGTLAHYLEAQTIPALYAKILARYETDYERDHPGLVRDTFTCLWAARRGLAEAELLDLLGSNGAPLPRAHWAPLALAAEQALVSRSGLLGFAHAYLRQAVQDRYLPTSEAERAAHRRLADYFAGRELMARRVDEEPWHLDQAAAWDRLAARLTDLPFFAAAWQAAPFDAKAYWARLEAHTPLRMADAYRPVLADPAAHHAYVWDLATLLQETGYPAEALALRGYLVTHYRRTGDRASLARALGNQAHSLYVRGDLDGAMALHKEKERLCRELGDPHGLAISLANQADTLGLSMDRPKEGLPLAEEAHRLAGKSGYGPLSKQIEAIRDKIRKRIG